MKDNEALTQSEVKSDVAVVYDYESMASFRIQRQSFLMDYKQEVYRLYRPFYKKNINMDVIPSDSDFDKYKVGSGIPHIYFKDYSYERIYYPNSALRIMIAKVLDAYETKVETEKEMLSALQKQKAFLLQSMFI